MEVVSTQTHLAIVGGREPSARPAGARMKLRMPGAPHIPRIRTHR